MLFSVRRLLSAVLFTALLVACNSAPKPDSQESVPVLKILVTGSGMYRIDSRQLQTAGWKPGNLDPQQIEILYHGRPQPFWLQGQGAELDLRFYGQSTDSRYTTQNVYWLVKKGFLEADVFGSAGTWATTTRDQLFGDPLASELDPANTYLAATRVEQNQVYSPQVEAGDHWFWLSMPAPQTQEFEFEVDHVAPGPGRIAVEVWASTEAPESPDHHLILRLNDQQVADQAWDGKGRHRIVADLPSNLLQDGPNRLQIDAPGDTGVAADISYLDWFAVQYPRKLVPAGDRLEFAGQDVPQHISGFTRPVTVYDITQPDAIQLAGEFSGEGGGFDFAGASGHRYLAVSENGYLKPTAILPARMDPDLRAPNLGADYIALGPGDLLTPLQPLLDWRAVHGLHTLALPVEAIYDQFGGLPEPEAIRAFLRYAVNNWGNPPKYVLLVGDATYDPRGYLSSPAENRLPVFLVNTVFGGETASDVVFAQLDDDAWPDLALGRIPAQTPRQVEILVRKILDYERETSKGNWQRSILAVADGETPYFQTEAQDFLDRFPASFTKNVFAPQAGVSGANAQLTRLFDDGDFLVAYFGHGSVDTWGKDRLFSTEDVPGLSNRGRLPVVINMTCLTGLFTHPRIESLAESLLWQSGGGAVAVLAPTSLTLPTDQGFLSQALVDAMLAEPKSPLGDILQVARKKVPGDTPGTLDVMQTFLLFGDPALQLKYP